MGGKGLAAAIKGGSDPGWFNEGLKTYHLLGRLGGEAEGLIFIGGALKAVADDRKLCFHEVFPSASQIWNADR